MPTVKNANSVLDARVDKNRNSTSTIIVNKGKHYRNLTMKEQSEIKLRTPRSLQKEKQYQQMEHQPLTESRKKVTKTNKSNKSIIKITEESIITDPEERKSKSRKIVKFNSQSL